MRYYYYVKGYCSVLIANFVPMNKNTVPLDLGSDKISLGHAKVIIGLSEEEQKIIIDSIVGQKLSVRETEKLIKKLLAPKKELVVNEKSELDPVFEDIQKNIEEIFGTKVQINAKKNKDNIEIEYFSNDELERILDLMEQISHN